MNDDQKLEYVHRISGLLCKYIRQDITEDELTSLYNWAYANEANKELFDEMSDLTGLWESLGYMLEIDREGVLRQVRDRFSFPEDDEP